MEVEILPYEEGQRKVAFVLRNEVNTVVLVSRLSVPGVLSPPANKLGAGP